MSDPAPLVSIGVPVFNGENYLAETLDSLLIQSYAEFEIIISDNGSTDSTESICRQYEAKDKRVKYYRYEVNKGAAWNFNNTFYLSKGKYFKWAAHDDPYLPDFVGKCVQLLDEKPEVVLCFTRTMFIDSEGQDLKEFIYPLDLFTADRRDRFRRFVMGGWVVHEIFGLIRSEVLKNTPLIRGYWGSDLVLLGMLTLRGPFFQIDEILFKHREHEKRSIKDPQGANNTTQWFDSSKSGKFVLPLLRLTLEHAKTVAFEKSLSLKEKFVYWYDVARVANWNRKGHQVEIVYIFKSLIRRN